MTYPQQTLYPPQAPAEVTKQQLLEQDKYNTLVNQKQLYNQLKQCSRELKDPDTNKKVYLGGYAHWLL